MQVELTHRQIIVLMTLVRNEEVKCADLMADAKRLDLTDNEEFYSDRIDSLGNLYTKLLEA